MSDFITYVFVSGIVILLVAWGYFIYAFIGLWQCDRKWKRYHRKQEMEMLFQNCLRRIQKL